MFVKFEFSNLVLDLIGYVVGQISSVFYEVGGQYWWSM